MNHIVMDRPVKILFIFQSADNISCVLPISSKLPKTEVALELKHIQYRTKPEQSVTCQVCRLPLHF